LILGLDFGLGLDSNFSLASILGLFCRLDEELFLMLTEEKSEEEMNELINATCKTISRNMANRSRKFKKQQPGLEEHFFQAAFLRLWTLKKKNKIDFSNPRLKQYLFTSARGAVLDEIRSHFITASRYLQNKKKKWECPDCGYETDFGQHYVVHGRKSICPCGRKIIWTIDPLDDPKGAVALDTDLASSTKKAAFLIRNRVYNEDNLAKVDAKDELNFVTDINPELKKILELIYLKEMTAKKVANMFSRSETWICHRKQKALEKCKKRAEMLI